jgi:hypothetical protein
MALGFGLTSVRGNRGVNYEKMNRWFATKHLKKKNRGTHHTILQYLCRKRNLLQRWNWWQDFLVELL